MSLFLNIKQIITSSIEEQTPPPTSIYIFTHFLHYQKNSKTVRLNTLQCSKEQKTCKPKPGLYRIANRLT